MKKTILLLTYTLVFYSFSSDHLVLTEKFNSVPRSDMGKAFTGDESLCDIFSKDYIQKIFPGAGNFNTPPYSGAYEHCSYDFDIGDKNYHTGVTVVRKYASLKNFEKAMSIKSMAGKQELPGLGEKAYYIPKLGQVSLYASGIIMHVYVNNREKGKTGQTGHKEKAIEMARYMLEKAA